METKKNYEWIWGVAFFTSILFSLFQIFWADSYFVGMSTGGFELHLYGVFLFVIFNVIMYKFISKKDDIDLLKPIESFVIVSVIFAIVIAILIQLNVPPEFFGNHTNISLAEPSAGFLYDYFKLLVIFSPFIVIIKRIVRKFHLNSDRNDVV